MAKEKRLGLRQLLSSAGAAFIGVQSNRTRERDFSQGRPRDFIILGLVFTLLFILCIWGMVQLVMSLAT
jgi:hypothetical protein